MDVISQDMIRLPTLEDAGRRDIAFALDKRADVSAQRCTGPAMEMVRFGGAWPSGEVVE